MNAITRQDVQNITDNLRNRIIERMITKQDVLGLHDAIRQSTTLVQQNQMSLRNGEQYLAQILKRVELLESRINETAMDIKKLQYEVENIKLAEQNPQVQTQIQHKDNSVDGRQPGVMANFGWR